MSKRYREYKIYESIFNELDNKRGKHKKLLSFSKFRQSIHNREKITKKYNKIILNFYSRSPHKKKEKYIRLV